MGSEPKKGQIILSTTQPERSATIGRLPTGNAVRIYDVTGRRIHLPATGVFFLLENNSRKKFIQLI
jgi:hypothetical protein